MVLHLPLSADEVVGRLSLISKTRRHGPGHHPFIGTVKAPEFLLYPTARRAAGLRVRGTIQSDGSCTTLELETAVAGRPLAVGATVLALLVVGLVAWGVPAGGVLFLTARIGISLAVAALGAFVSVRVGTSHVRRTILTALDPSAELAGHVAAGDSNQADLDPEKLIERLEEWARRPPK